MNLAILAVALFIVVVALWLRPKKQESTGGRRAKPARSSGAANATFHAVSINFPANACDAARQRADHRFLSSEAPRLPLPECNVLECTCHFRHHKDRRKYQDRRSVSSGGYALGSSGIFKAERRQGKDRREGRYAF